MRTRTTEDTKREVQAAYEQLEQALENIDSNEEWLKYLSFQAKFYNYSFSNMIMIFNQMPLASYVAGYKTWQTLGRHVMKGAKSIKIFAPLRRNVEADGEDEEAYVIQGFKLASIFDLSQTIGDDNMVPVLVTGLRDGHDCDDVYQKLLSIIEIPVTETEISSNGLYNIKNPKIQIKSTLSTTHKVKTLIHEYAHHLHHTHLYNDESYDIGEVIAESSAYIVCSYLKINSADYSFGYIKGWCKDLNIIKKVGHKAQVIAHSIIEQLEQASNSENIPAVRGFSAKGC